jgi:hypothetical protein
MKQFFQTVSDSGAFYGKPDAEYFLDKYVRFSTMEEVLREYVVEVLVRRRKEDFQLIMVDGKNRIFIDDPTLFINGIPVFETNKMMQYDPLKIKKLELVNRRYFYGPLIFNGMVNFITYQPDPEMPSGLNATIIKYEGLQFKRQFYSPVYETPQQVSDRAPDFRNTLYWSPDLTTGKDGKGSFNFYTADTKGEYIAIIEGLNGQGKAGQTSLRFQVK